MIDYTIAAVPTQYRGREYRSRLEAYWAAYFDILGWDHAYEPFSLGTWLPDFYLPQVRALVEIKPWTDIQDETWNKIVGATNRRGDIDTVILTQHEPFEADGLTSIGQIGLRRDNFMPLRAYLYHAAYRIDDKSAVGSGDVGIFGADPVEIVKKRLERYPESKTSIMRLLGSWTTARHVVDGTRSDATFQAWLDNPGLCLGAVP